MNAEVTLKPGERIDDLQRNGRVIIQNPARFCFGIDAVLLSGFAKVKRGEKTIDLGSGNGILPILLEAKYDGESFTGLEIQPENVDMARRSADLNRTEKVRFVEGDIKEAVQIFGKNSTDVVVSNPPYMKAGSGLKNPTDAKMIARHEVLVSLNQVIEQTASLLIEGGRCYFVHRPFRLVDIFSSMRQNQLEPKRLRLVYSQINKEPILALIEGKKHGGVELKVEPPLILYESDGKTYTREMRENYGF
ncbi:MAG: tRNA1(Val) (adenine(37)-N6)-methyltransferase [Lachnospiraceae bacterium]|uniref:tRNA1(Val) (Adenine(37)-N6)-methyltransferase n=1 Tax=Candidatus Weimeria bifida TaxID=2599074 RepID=A0A6N7J051_9FIRM|nr:tRNA1(Val) (adenine(37)-N6)-methyltransferase [Candidatus Weimeria bifida]RRF95290.1 MAG: tRNA1(Val) (adenine(37)-N6)-methyltransferase [Lachnospiraceae bacterium]